MEGKADPSTLKHVFNHVGSQNPGIVVGPTLGVDAAVIDHEEACIAARDYYGTGSQVKCYPVWKTDPVTFLTDNPGKYVLSVNLNDLGCLGAVPYAALVTWILPTSYDGADLVNLQQQLGKEAKKYGVTIAGGHSEFSRAVNTPVVVLSTVGFTPEPFLPHGRLNPGDSIYLQGFVANEGTAILGAEVVKRSNIPADIKELLPEPLFEEHLCIVNEALELNKKAHPSVMHDPTEGGILGAIHEMLTSRKIGAALDTDALESLIHPLTRKLCDWLKVDPLRLISSGSLLFCLPKGHEPPRTIHTKKIGELTDDTFIYLSDEEPTSPPEADHLILALQNLAKQS